MYTDNTYEKKLVAMFIKQLDLGYWLKEKISKGVLSAICAYICQSLLRVSSHVTPSLLTHWDRDEIDATFQTTFSNVFSSVKMYEFRLRFHWILLLGPVNNIPALVKIMAWHRAGDKPLSEPMLVRSLTHICVTRPQWVNRWVNIGWLNHSMYSTARTL